MQFKRFLIAPLGEGLVNNVKSWLTPDNAFSRMKNAYPWRGRVKKRPGSVWIDNVATALQSKVRLRMGTTTAGGVLTATVPGTYRAIGQQFTIGDAIYTVNSALAGAQPMLQTVATATATFNIGTGVFSFIGAPALSAVYWYPNTPIMGLTLIDEPAINSETTVAFDQQFVYKFDGAVNGFECLGPVPPAAGSAQWSVVDPLTDVDFPWSTMWQNSDSNVVANNKDLLFVVNNKALNGVLDGVKYYDIDAATWTSPQFVLDGAGNALVGARIVLPFKGRLLFFSTFESNYGTPFYNRVRYSWTRSLIDTTAGINNGIANAFLEASGKGGYIDAPTTEAIVSAEFVKDRLVVYFERSTYQLLYTGAPDLPFTWHKIDTAVGAESMNSRIPFDNTVLGIGASGIHSCNGATVSRIDQKIPQEVFQFQNNENAFERVTGIRDFIEEMAYWTFPNIKKTPQNSTDFPQNLLAYDYTNGTWAIHDDSFTALGYHFLFNGFIWNNWNTTWDESDWTWDRAENVEKQRNVIMGNQQGYVVMLSPNTATNAAALSIADIVGDTLTIVNHNLNQEDYIHITGATGVTNINGLTHRVTNVVDNNTVTITTVSEGDPYEGGGVAARVSQIDILTKEYNFFTNNAQNTFIPYVEFLVDRAELDVANPDVLPGIYVDYAMSFSNQSVLEQTPTGSLLGTNFLETSPYPNSTFEDSQQQFWHRVYFQATGDSVQFRLHYTDELMFQLPVTNSMFVLNAMLIYASPDGTRLGI